MLLQQQYTLRTGNGVQALQNRLTREEISDLQLAHGNLVRLIRQGSVVFGPEQLLVEDAKNIHTGIVEENGSEFLTLREDTLLRVLERAKSVLEEKLALLERVFAAANTSIEIQPLHLIALAKNLEVRGGSA